MTSETPESVEHSELLDQLVRLFSMVAIRDRELRADLEQVPAWHAASAFVRPPGHQLSASQVLAELIGGLQVAARDHPALARTLMRDPGARLDLVGRGSRGERPRAVAPRSTTRVQARDHRRDRHRAAPGGPAALGAQFNRVPSGVVPRHLAPDAAHEEATGVTRAAGQP